MRRLLLTATLFLSVPLAQPLAAARAPEPPGENQKWIVVRADDIEIFSNGSPSAALNVARELLRMREAVSQVSRLKVRSPIPTKVFLFANERTFEPYRDVLFPRDGENVTGVFAGSDDANFILLRGDAEGGVDRVVYHELTYYFVKNTVGAVPLWLSEGIAEYYSTFRSFGDKIHIGRPVRDHIAWLRQKPLIPLRDLFSMDHDSPEYNEGTLSGVFYAQSWALVHYLLLGNDERRAQFSKFLALSGEGKSIDEAFQQGFGITYAQLEQELRAYVRKFSMKYMSYSLNELKIEEPPKPEPMKRDALLYQLGHLLGYVDRNQGPAARKFLDAALALNPSHAGAHADLGRLHELAGDQKASEAAFARAAELGSDDPMVYILLGRSVVQKLEGSDDPSNDQLLRARALFTKATELDPQSARAWMGIGITYLAGRADVRPGIAAMEKAASLSPGDADIRNLLERLREREQVRQINEAIDLANAGKFAEAVAQLDRVIPEMTDAEMAKSAKTMRDEIAKRVRR